MNCSTKPFISHPEGDPVHAHVCTKDEGHGVNTIHECGDCGYQWVTEEWDGKEFK